MKCPNCRRSTLLRDHGDLYCLPCSRRFPVTLEAATRQAAELATAQRIEPRGGRTPSRGGVPL